RCAHLDMSLLLSPTVRRDKVSDCDMACHRNVIPSPRNRLSRTTVVYQSSLLLAWYCAFRGCGKEHRISDHAPTCCRPCTTIFPCGRHTARHGGLPKEDAAATLVPFIRVPVHFWSSDRPAHGANRGANAESVETSAWRRCPLHGSKFRDLRCPGVS